MISLRNRLILTYSVFISIALFILTAGINIFAGMIFDKFIMDTIEERSGEIVRTVGELYNPIEKNFDRDTLEAVGMLFVHDGYIIDVEDAGMVTLWNARDMNMGHCVEVLNEINNRMKTRYGVNSELQNRSFPIKYHGANVGVVNIATVGPIFYSETQGQFLTSLNRLLIAAALFFIIISVGISVILAFSIAEPVKAASGAARKIASFYKLGGGKELYSTSLIEDYKTHELSELSKSINSLARELAESERRQKQLTSDIAHELRTPLTGLQ
jgi:signal transduction histidine kinase